MIASAMIAGFALGASGSLHCIGMCGPLSLALPLNHFSKLGKFFALLLYQFGRILTYSLIGFFFGLVGHRIYLAGFQQSLSILLGSVIVLLVIMTKGGKRGLHFSMLNQFYFKVQKVISSLLKKGKGPFSFLLLGMANGFLPCGMVYIALAGIFSFTRISDAVLYMAMFGAGTLPAMMLVGYASHWLKPSIRLNMRKAIPYVMMLMGGLLILRGLNLGIPFVSPSLPSSPEAALICHP